MTKIVVVGFALSLILTIPVYAQDDGIVYTCQADDENDIVAAAQAAYDAEDWDIVIDFAEQGEAICIDENKHRNRRLVALRGNAEEQLFYQNSYPGMVDLGDYSIFMRCIGEGSPTIIFENGLAISVAQSWDDISPEFEDITQVCTYDRVGVGVSDSLPPDSIRSTQDMVTDLVQILEFAEINEPYIFVGHSVASFNMLLFADQYPDAVAGMVMIDPSHPNQILFLAEIDPDNAPVAGQAFTIENMDLWTSASEVDEVGNLGDIPLFVLTAGDNVDEDTDVDQIWLEWHEEHAARSTNSQHLIVEGAPHFIMQTDPDVVITAIDWVWEQATGETILRDE